MFVAFSTVELALTCYTHLYIFYFLFLVCVYYDFSALV